MSRLWDRDGASLDERIERFTVGRDRELDRHLLAHDALASAAHVLSLATIGILSPAAAEAARRELAAAAREAREGRFGIAADEEDAHTALENRLIARLGDTGRRLHTGRSRNDQVLAALRLWGREAVLALLDHLLGLVELLLDLATRHREVDLPGYSHARQAMPSTAGFLFAAHAEGLLDDVPWLETAFAHLDRSPLGSASGYGVALPLDREGVAARLAFGRLQVNALAVQNDRGKGEFLALAAAAATALDLSRLAADLIWFSSDELACFRLPETVTTGSSLMPQKRNPDVLELVRAGAARLAARQSEVAAICGGLVSGYHRDLQLTKEPFLEGMLLAADLPAVLSPVLAGLLVDAERCRAVIRPASGATDALYGRVAAGEPFRSAYREVARDPQAAVGADYAAGWRRRTHTGAPGRLDLEPLAAALAAGRRRLAERQARVAAAWALLDEGEPAAAGTLPAP